jgi:hypothetical protein
VELKAPGIELCFPASSRSVVLIVASICSAFVLAVALIFVAAQVENVEAAGGWLGREAPKPETATAPAVTIFDGLDDEPVMAPRPPPPKAAPAKLPSLPDPEHPP